MQCSEVQYIQSVQHSIVQHTAVQCIKVYCCDDSMAYCVGVTMIKGGVEVELGTHQYLEKL